MLCSLYGATGFVGSNMLRRHHDRFVAQPRADRSPVNQGDVLYMISTTHNYNFFESATIDPRTNIDVLCETLDAFRRLPEPRPVFNFVSSWFVYGKCTELPASELTRCEPRGFYSITKKCAEDLLISFCTTFDIRYRILRLCNVYGPGDKGASVKKNALQHLIGLLARDERVELYHGGDVMRDYMHVDDVCDAIVTVLQGGELDTIYNIGSGVPSRFGDLIMFACDCLGSASEIVARAPSEFHTDVQVRDMFLDVRRLAGLGFRPRVSIDDGIRELCDIVDTSLRTCDGH